ncbi:GEVED domain-containing protein [Polluticoccus soli]|uniref:T9SS type A sorting domain-containing protein n=1 Tax=Polluticoccus soli TaxID=3034150 RepID=UPI0023E144A9|nr:GEVED domain-containing protein [Flavipsychrobacter sp. JY13-12]
MKRLYALAKFMAASLGGLLLSGSVAAQYCTTGLYSLGCGLDYIVSVTTTNGITNINNTNTGCTNTNGTGYTYYSSQTHTGQLSSTVNYNILNNASWTEGYGMWVDFNIDGDFDDPGEQVYTGTLGGGGSAAGSFAIPPTATPGNSRLRVRCNYGSTPGPCTQLYEGECEDYNFVILSPCVGPTGLNVTGITSQAATVGWSAVTPSIGYDYAVDQSATGPTGTPIATTSTSAPVSGLTPSTNYWLHVRNKCSPTAPSAWAHYAFTTLPPCKPPLGFKTFNLKPTASGLKWDPWLSATDYDYIVDQVRTDPTSTTGLQNVTNPSDNIPNGLQENTWYYIHIRSNCVGEETSLWGLDSFLTPIVCRPPVINISHINTDHAVAYWSPVLSATEYEYAITTSPTPPAIGTKYNYTSIQMSALYDGKDYYIHVRAHCSSVNTVSTSDWATASFKTFPVSVSGANGDEAYIEAYPNPVKGTLSIDVHGLMHGNATIAITDINGKVLRNLTLKSSKTTIDMSDLASGLYLLKYTDDQRTETVRLTKQ